LDAPFFPREKSWDMPAEIIDLALLVRARRCYQKMLKARGIAYFLAKDARRPFRIDASRVELVIRAAMRLRPASHGRPPARAVDHCRQVIRRELIQKVAELMLQVGL
jgi:hypothetical protein